jgi:SNF2 family DNA or RNA helicase
VLPDTPICAYRLSRVHSEFDRDLAEHGRVLVEDGVYPLPTRRWLPPSDSWEHQLHAGDWLNEVLGDRGSALLYMGLGTGKTKVILDLAARRRMLRVLVVCPLSVIPAWRKQADLHYPGHWRTLLLGKSINTSSMKAKHLQRELDVPFSSSRCAGQNARRLLTVVNYDSAWRGQLGELIRSVQWDLIVADESHALKGRDTKRMRFFASAYEFSRFRVALTGTPLSAGRLTDAWGQMRFLDPGVFGNSVTKFENQFAYKPPGQHFVTSWRNVDEFNRRFWWITHHEDRAVLDLPPSTDVERISPFPRDSPAVRIYRELEQDFVADLEAGVIFATNAAVRLSKLQQVTSGDVLMDGEPQLVHRQKQVMLIEVLRELGDEPVVVFYKFKADARQIEDACQLTWGASSPNSFSELSGDRKDLEQWQRGDTQVLAVQWQAGSEGIDLTRARYAIFFSMTYSLGQWDQARARVHRPGQEHPVTYISLTIEGTVDTAIRRALMRKQNVVDAVLEGGIDPE